MDKTEVLSSEYVEINNIIALAKADSEVEQILLSEVSREFKDHADIHRERVFFEDMVFEVIELAKHDNTKKVILLNALLESDIANDLQQHFYDFFGSNGIIREQG